MHELSLARDLVDAVEPHAAGRRVHAVRLEVGRLAGVDADALRFCFEVCVQGTPLEGATLDILDVPGRGRCRTCGVEAAIEGALPLCACGSADVELIAGTELRVRALEVS